MNSAGKWCAILFLATSVVAQTSTPPKAKKKTKARDVNRGRCAGVEGRDRRAAGRAGASSSKQIQQLRDELHRKDQAVHASAGGGRPMRPAKLMRRRPIQPAAADCRGTEERRDRPEDQREQHGAVAAGDAEERNTAIESPLAMHYKGITITPGGFLAAEFVRRSRALGSDINTPFNSLTMPGACAKQRFQNSSAPDVSRVFRCWQKGG